MSEYHKIQTVWLRDAANHNKTILEGQWAKPEFEYLANNAWEWTEKIDGTNIRVWWDGERTRYGGRTDNAQIPRPLLAKLQELFGDNKVLQELGRDCILYGEGYGAKIQKGGGNYIPDGCSFILFDVKIGQWWLRRDDVYSIAGQLNILHVPVVNIGTLNDAVRLVREGLLSSTAAVKHKAEGLVMRPVIDLWDRRGERIIAKVKARDFA